MQLKQGARSGRVLELYLALNAHPRNEGGLAPSTYERYEWTIGRHLLGKPRRRLHGGMKPPPCHALAVTTVPARRFNEPQAPRAWREDMLMAGVSKPTDRRQRVRYQSENAQRPLRVCDRRFAPARATPRRCRVARRTYRRSGPTFA